MTEAMRRITELVLIVMLALTGVAAIPSAEAGQVTTTGVRGPKTTGASHGSAKGALTKQTVKYKPGDKASHKASRSLAPKSSASKGKKTCATGQCPFSIAN